MVFCSSTIFLRVLSLKEHSRSDLHCRIVAESGTNPHLSLDEKCAKEQLLFPASNILFILPIELPCTSLRRSIQKTKNLVPCFLHSPTFGLSRCPSHHYQWCYRGTISRPTGLQLSVPSRPSRPLCSTFSSSEEPRRIAQTRHF